MAKAIREWRAFCPYCDQPHVYSEYANDKGCPKQNCIHCGTKFVCPSYKYDCSTCVREEKCMENPSVESVIHRSTWRGWFRAKRLGFHKLAARDLNCIIYMRGEDKVNSLPPEEKRLQMVHHNLSVTTLETGKGALVIWKPRAQPAFHPVQIRLGFFGRR